MARSATMQKVADNVGVSVSTVSRILNSPDFAKKETRESVLKAAARLGYAGLRRRGSPSPVAPLAGHERAEGALNTIVLLAPESALDRLQSPDWIFGDVIPTLQRVAREKGFHLILSSYGPDDQWDSAVMTDRHICGVLWMAHDQED